MTLSQTDIETIRRSHGADTTLGERPNDKNPGGTPPYGYTLVGALNKIEEIAEHMDEYGLSYSDLSAEKQDEMDLAHEALKYHIENLSNVLADGFVGNDDSLELPNGKTVDLPRAAIEATNSKNLPDPPSN